MTRYGSATTVLGRLPSGLTVTMALYKASDGSTVTITNTCTEIGSTGVYRWPTSNITTQPTVETDYFYRMTTGQYQYEGKFSLKAPDMRGTDNAALASVCTETRLAELDAANMPADIDAILEDTGTTLENKIKNIKNLLAMMLP